MDEAACGESSFLVRNSGQPGRLETLGRLGVECVNIGSFGLREKALPLVVPMVETVILEEPSARARFRTAPLLKEREQYLSYLLQSGISLARVRSVSGYLIHLIRLMGLTTLRTVTSAEIVKAGESWAACPSPDRGRRPGKSSTYALGYVARNWFRFHGRLETPPVPLHPFQKELDDFVEFLRSTHSLSPMTILGYSSRAKLFLSWLADRTSALSRVCLTDVDDFFGDKRSQGWLPCTVANHAKGLRAFFGYAGMRNWCAPTLAAGIRTPPLPKFDGLSKGPTWKDVRRMLRFGSKTTTISLRARAILLLCSIYALRSSEVAGLRLSDIDWREETLYVRRAKRGGYQRYPLRYEVGEAIIRYVTKGRPRCACRTVFVTRGQPYRPLSASVMWQIVSRRFERLGIASVCHGPHALRHACATHLLKKGSSLREIADFLGHRDVKSTAIYAKYDTRSLLRDVAAFRLAGL